MNDAAGVVVIVVAAGAWLLYRQRNTIEPSYGSAGDSYIDWFSWDKDSGPVANDEDSMGNGIYRDPSLPRGIRNRNPGNIELGDNWRGLSDEQTDGRFAQFDDAVYGIRALARVLQNYQRIYGINTIRGVIERWAPSHENNVDAYASSVAQESGISQHAPIDLTRDETLQRIVPAIIRHENGMQPYAAATIERGISLA